MHKNFLTVVGITVLFLGMSFAQSVAINNEKKSSILLSSGNTLYVGGSGPGNYTTIQGAINDANDGDTVFVFNGTYYGAVNIGKSINLIGENRDITKIIINEGIYYYAVDISADLVKISGFTIKCDTDEQITGIKLSGSSNNNTIIGNIILDFYWGIYLSSSSNNIIKNNNFSNNAHDIILEENCMNNTITGNTFLNTWWCYSIWIRFSSNNIISDNTFSNVQCVCIDLYSSNKNIVRNNTIISVPGGSGIRIEYSKENIIIGNTIKDLPHKWESGISLRSATDNIVTSNNLICCNNGISLYNEEVSNDNTLHHNNFFNNTQNAFDECSNIWDNGYPSGGNFWDDYEGEDNDGDGIGDTPYNISGGDNQDRYPLMEPWGDNLFPISKFIWTPMHPDPDETILFNASQSIDYDGNIILYEWDWDNDGEYDESHTIPTATHIFDEIGYYQVTLKVIDNDNLANSKTKTVKVGNLPPQASNITGPNYGKPGVEYTFCIDVIEPDVDQIYCMWNWGDGTTSEWLGPYNSGETICVSHAWSEEGVYEIKIKLKDEYGTESDWSEPHIITIDGSIPKVDITKPSRAIYIKDRWIIPFIVPVIFGDIQIWFWAEDSLSGLNHTELYINNELKGVFTSIPKSWTWNETTPLKYRYVIKLIAYDNAGNNATKKITVWRFF